MKNRTSLKIFFIILKDLFLKTGIIKSENILSDKEIKNY